MLTLQRFFFFLEVAFANIKADVVSVSCVYGSTHKQTNENHELCIEVDVCIKTDSAYVEMP